MNKKIGIVDIVAGTALLGMVAVSAWAQVGGPNPQPVTKTCPASTVTVNGEEFEIDEIECFEWQDCGFTVTVNSETGQVQVKAACVIIA